MGFMNKILRPQEPELRSRNTPGRSNTVRVLARIVAVMDTDALAFVSLLTKVDISPLFEL